jgi:hypothetical protein
MPTQPPGFQPAPRSKTAAVMLLLIGLGIAITSLVARIVTLTQTFVHIADPASDVAAKQGALDTALAIHTSTRIGLWVGGAMAVAGTAWLIGRRFSSPEARRDTGSPST